MSWRPWIVASLLMVGVIVNVSLLFFEVLVVSDEQARTGATFSEVDPHLGMVFSTGERMENLQAFGLPTAMAQRAHQRAVTLSRQRGAYLRAFMEENPDDFLHALCGRLPARYGALELLIDGEGGNRRVIDLGVTDEIMAQPWFEPDLTFQVHGSLELVGSPQSDSTAMGVAAILAGRERDAIAGEPPWGQGIGRRWSFGHVLAEHSGLEQRLVEYFAGMHLLAELAHREGGVCADQAEGEDDE